MTTRLTKHAAVKLRIESLLLGSKRLSSAGSVARWLGAMQSQDLASGKWSFGARLERSTEADIDAAIARGEVLRTWPMRGTLHFVPAEDARWMLEITGVKTLSSAGARRAALGLDEKTIHRAADILGAALAGGRRLGRAEATEHLSNRGIAIDGQRAYHLLWSVSQMGVTCIGPNRGKEQTFVLLAEWAPKQRTLSKDEALGTLARRYFRGHGPATQHDFSGWTGLNGAETKRAMSIAERDLASCLCDGKTMWMDKSLLDGAHDPTKQGSSKVHVLPGFDEYLLGIKDRSLVVPTAHAPKIIPGNNGVFMPTMVAGGVVIGTWKRQVKRDRVIITPLPFDPLSRTRHAAFDRAFRAYARYLGATAQIGWDGLDRV